MLSWKSVGRGVRPGLCRPPGQRFLEPSPRVWLPAYPGCTTPYESEAISAGAWGSEKGTPNRGVLFCLPKSAALGLSVY